MGGTFVDVALPTITSALVLSPTDAHWVNAIYNVIFAAWSLMWADAAIASDAAPPSPPV